MIICDKEKFAFIHIHKTAGSSIRNFLINNFEIRDPYGPHIPIKKLHHLEPKTQSYYTFAIVRNPWDWLVSLYCYIKKTPGHPRHNLISKMSFPEYLNWTIEISFKDRETPPDLFYQKDYIVKSGEIAVNFVGRFENLDEDFDKILKHLGTKSEKLPHINKSRQPASYHKIYTPKTRDLVAKYWAEDIERFNYSY